MATTTEPMTYDEALKLVVLDYAAEHAEETARWREGAEAHRAEWEDAGARGRPFFERRADAWATIAAGAHRRAGVTFAEQRQIVAHARLTEAGYRLKAVLHGIDLTDHANADLLRDALADYHRAVDRHGWVAGIASTTGAHAA